MQQDLLLKTKLYIPRERPNLVPRPRLVELIEQGIGQKLTLLSAPPGFGKTTLLSEWVRRCSSPVAWLSLDEGDNELTRFLFYVVAALQTVHAEAGDMVLALLESSQQVSPEPVLTSLINDLAESNKWREDARRPITLILDDYHVIEDQSVHLAISFLLEHMPPPPVGPHMIIASRTNPPLPLPRLRARGQLAELGSTDLRFTVGEAAAFLNQVMGLGLSAEDVATLESRTEGWIAGLQLAALALQGTLSRQGTKNLPGFVKAFSGSHRHVLDYLADEVFDRQPEHIRAFLLQTSILDYLTGGLCDAVCGTDRRTDEQHPGRGVGASWATLEMLERANLFVVPLDDERRWYRYHPLFADQLRYRLEREMPEQVPMLHRRACEWYAHNGRVYEAMGHALAAGDVERAAGLVEETDSATMVLRGEATTLLGWLDALPEDVVRSRSRLSLSYAWALMVVADVDAIESRLQDALRAMGIQAEAETVWPDSPPTELQGVLGEVAALRAFVALCRDDPHRAVELTLQALRHMPQDNLLVRGAVGSFLGDAYVRLDDIRAASQAYARALTDCQSVGHVTTIMIMTNDLARLHVAQGQLHQAAGSYRQVLELGSGRRRSHYPVERAYMGLGDLLREWNDLDGAERYLTEGVRHCELGGYTRYLVFGYPALARVQAARGDAKAVADAMRKAERLAEKTGVSRFVSQVAAHSARLALSPAMDNLPAATHWAQTCGLSFEDQPSYSHELEYLTLVRVLLAEAKEAQNRDILAPAVELLARLYSQAETAGRIGSLIEILVLQSLVLQALNRTARASATFDQSLTLAEPEGYTRLFVDEGPPMADLLRQAASRGTLIEYVGRLLGTFGQANMPGAAGTHALVDPLTAREMEVLRLLAVGLSNREISQELSITLSTVKTHTRRIYSKLDVRNRTQAVARAREWALLH